MTTTPATLEQSQIDLIRLFDSTTLEADRAMALLSVMISAEEGAEDLSVRESEYVTLCVVREMLTTVRLNLSELSDLNQSEGK